jgi:hypothetical protein
MSRHEIFIQWLKIVLAISFLIGFINVAKDIHDIKIYEQNKTVDIR